MSGKPVRLGLLLSLLLVSVNVGGEYTKPLISFQQFEIQFEKDGEVNLEHHMSIEGVKNWNGQVKITYPFGIDHIFEGPGEILTPEDRFKVTLGGCKAVQDPQFAKDRTELFLDLSQCDEMAWINTEIKLLDVVEDVRHYANPFLVGGGSRKRFSMVTAECNLVSNKTKVLVHLPPGEVVSNFLPTENVTVLPFTEDAQTITWVFTERSAEQARVYVEFGSRDKIGPLMMVIIAGIIFGLVAMVVKLFLIMYEESPTY